MGRLVVYRYECFGLEPGDAYAQIGPALHECWRRGLR